MPIAAQTRYSNDLVIPVYPNIPAPLLPVRLLPSLTLAKGTVLGEHVATGAVSTTLNGAITGTGLQTITVTAGTNIQNMQGRQLLIDVGVLQETVTVLTTPTAVTFTAVVSRTHLTGVAVTGAAPTASTGMYGVYTDANTDGTGVAKCILEYACATDTSGNITLGTGSLGGPYGETTLTVPAYFGGSFKTSELTGLDAAAIVDLNGHLMHGTIADGVLAF